MSEVNLVLAFAAGLLGFLSPCIVPLIPGYLSFISGVGTFMKANLKRDGDAARWYYPIMMKGEWPVLLNVLGKGEGEQRYLSVAEVRTLFVEKRLPERITARLPLP